MNMILHNNPTALIVQGNTLTDPKLYYHGNLNTFDYAVANPPFSDKRWRTGLDPLHDTYDRFQPFCTPLAKQGDYATCCTSCARCAAPARAPASRGMGVLFLGNAEADIRRALVRKLFAACDSQRRDRRCMETRRCYTGAVLRTTSPETWQHPAFQITLVFTRMTTRRQPTMQDVARRAGVGTTTVSRVINGGKRVSTKTLESVNRTIRELGYVPNLAARVLKGERSRTIGLIVPSIADPFFASCAEVVQKVARSFGSLVVVCVTGNEPALELENIESLCRRVDGILIAPSQSSNKLLNDRLAGLEIPVIAFDQPLTGLDIPGVVTNNHQSAKAMTRHLLQHGYERILCIGGEATFHTMVERTRGYAAAMREAGQTPVIDTAPHIRSEAETSAVLARHLSGRKPPRAIYCLKNTTTIQTYDALQRFGIRVPQEIALAGHDDFLLASSLRPSVTVVRQPVEEIGRTAARLLFARLSKQSDNPDLPQDSRTRLVRLQSGLVFRASCGCEEAEPTGLVDRFRLAGNSGNAAPRLKTVRKTATAD